MVIRQATRNDLEAIREIYNQAVSDGFCTAHLEEVDESYMASWFEGHSPGHYPVMVLAGAEGILGWYSLGPYRQGRQALDHVAEVSYYLHRSARGQGLGSRLMEHVLEYAPTLGLSVLLAILLARNPASIALLEKYGFRCWGVLPGIARIGQSEVDHLYYGLKL